jgi:cysteinyl-tRNA synthetase, unknown class
MEKNKWFKLFIAMFLTLAAISCGDEEEGELDSVYKQRMREFVQNMSIYAKGKNSSFIIIPQNGQELVTHDGNEDGSPDMDYLDAIDGVGREDLFYGYDEDNVPTPKSELDYMLAFLNICEQNGVSVLTTDYCWDHTKMDGSYSQNQSKGFISFAAPDRELNTIPDYPADPFHVNSNDIKSLSEAKNFLYLLNNEKFNSKTDFISALSNTNYDAFIIDLFFDGKELSSTDIASLKTKKNGGKRLVIAYMSIGEAENYRYYWQTEWKVGSPAFIEKENPDWKGNYKVQYWNTEWQNIIYGSSDSYLDKIIAAGFDGVYLDIIDAFEYFE